MTIEEARKELGEYLHLLKLCDLKKRKIDELRRLVQSCKGMNYGEQLGSNGGNIAYQIAKIADFENELNEERLKAEETCNKIHEKIYKVGQEKVLYGNILEMRYVLGYKIEQIVLEIKYVFRQTLRFLKEATKMYAEID